MRMPPIVDHKADTRAARQKPTDIPTSKPADSHSGQTWLLLSVNPDKMPAERFDLLHRLLGFIRFPVTQVDQG
jgi:hypothetical protein